MNATETTCVGCGGEIGPCPECGQLELFVVLDSGQAETVDESYARETRRRGGTVEATCDCGKREGAGSSWTPCFCLRPRVKWSGPRDAAGRPVFLWPTDSAAATPHHDQEETLAYLERCAVGWERLGEQDQADRVRAYAARIARFE